MFKKLTKVVLVLLALVFVSHASLSHAQAAEKLNFLLVGTDSGYGRGDSLQASRSDALMIATMDPDTNTLTLSTIPRDTLVDIPGYGGDKVNHAFAFGGIDLTQAALEGWLGIEFDHYVATNMTGYIEIIDALNGLKVLPPATFSISGHDFVEGVEQDLNGDQALGYARERYTSGGDYARQARMREMVRVAIEKVIAQGDIEQYRSIFENRADYLITSLTFDEIVALYEQYGHEDLMIEEFQLTGSGYTDDVLGYIDVTDPASLEALLEIVR